MESFNGDCHCHTGSLDLENSTEVIVDTGTFSQNMHCHVWSVMELKSPIFEQEKRFTFHLKENYSGSFLNVKDKQSGKSLLQNRL